MSSILDRTSAQWNEPVYRPGTCNHLESYFLKGNDPQTLRAYWIKFTVYAPKNDPANAVGEVWAVVFDTPAQRVLAAKQVYSMSECVLTPGCIRMGASNLRQDGSEGELVTPSGVRLAWNLRYDGDSVPLVPFPWAWMYTARLPKTKTVTPHPDSRHSGRIVVGSDTWELREVPGMQGHNWGREHAYRYAWVHCNLFADGATRAVFEGFSAQLKIGPLLTPPISVGVLWLPDGRKLAFNRLKALRSPEVTIQHTQYRFRYAHADYRLSGAAEADAAAMAGLVYRNPDGTVSHCLNSKTANLRLMLEGPAGELLHLTSDRGAALETLTRDNDHPVRMLV